MKKSKQSSTKNKEQSRVNNLAFLQKKFYKLYNPDYWLCKISLLKNCHDYFDRIRDTLTTNLANGVEKSYKKMLRTELHFLYFQMIETLFEIIFAVSLHNNRSLWSTLTFSNWRKNYSKIEQFAEEKLKQPDFHTKLKTKIQGKEVEIPLLRWIFYFICPSKMTPDQWNKNLKNIEKLLRVFSKDFTDRNEYNAYKHSLRFFNLGVSYSIGIKGLKTMYEIGQSKDAITYLEACKKKDKLGKLRPTGQVFETTKSFDFERDYQCCLIIYRLIKNIINTRKDFFLEDLHGKKFQCATFYDIDFPEAVLPKTGITKSSFTC